MATDPYIPDQIGVARPGVCRCRSLSALLIGGDPVDMRRIRGRLSRHFGHVEFAQDLARAERLLPRCHFDVLVLRAEWLDGVGAAWLERWADGRRVIVAADPLARAPDVPGPCDFVPLPVRAEDVVATVHGECGPSAQADAGPGAGAQQLARQRHLVGESDSMCAIRRMIARVAPLPSTVLIEGETGTGKELAARLLHEQSGRRGPFVAVNCGAIAPELIESEIFGHAKGAFTGAHRVRDGLFVSARGGTLFLDEISEMRPDLQVKLLRALEEGSVRPVGSDREVEVDARIVASSQPGLAAKVANGAFREDLYYRLNLIHIVLPPLRQRPDDIAALADHFMSRVASDMHMPKPSLDARELHWLESRSWPGNVRELRNVIERAVLLGEWSQPEDCHPSHGDGDAPHPYPLDWTLEQVKQHHIERVLEANHGNRSAAARTLGVSRKTLERKLGPARDADAPTD
jgi:DNA-binding NtrC family response regulator